MSALSAPKLNAIQKENEVNEEEENHVDLSSLTKAELLSYAAENGIDSVNGSMKKADILNAIEESLEG